MALPKITTSV
jgi:hypothetical protein